MLALLPMAVVVFWVWQLGQTRARPADWMWRSGKMARDEFRAFAILNIVFGIVVAVAVQAGP
jgi:hypothetical protein